MADTLTVYVADMNTVNSTSLNQLGEDNFTYHPTSLTIGAVAALAAALVVSFSALAFISGSRKGGAGGERRCTRTAVEGRTAGGGLEKTYKLPPATWGGGWQGMRACGAVILSACVRWCTLETKAASCRAVRAFTQNPFASSRVGRSQYMRTGVPSFAFWVSPGLN